MKKPMNRFAFITLISFLLLVAGAMMANAYTTFAPMVQNVVQTHKTQIVESDLRVYSRPLDRVEIFDRLERELKAEKAIRTSA